MTSWSPNLCHFWQSWLGCDMKGIFLKNKTCISMWIHLLKHSYVYHLKDTILLHIVVLSVSHCGGFHVSQSDQSWTVRSFPAAFGLPEYAGIVVLNCRIPEDFALLPTHFDPIWLRTHSSAAAFTTFEAVPAPYLYPQCWFLRLPEPESD